MRRKLRGEPPRLTRETSQPKTAMVPTVVDMGTNGSIWYDSVAHAPAAPCDAPRVARPLGEPACVHVDHVGPSLEPLLVIALMQINDRPDHGKDRGNINSRAGANVHERE